ncbi:MAG: hypothetical protein JSS21_03245 [Proteobacteria bacterium]|nr:hypothetical protein [Pseudomonadota bacterium]
MLRTFHRRITPESSHAAKPSSALERIVGRKLAVSAAAVANLTEAEPQSLNGAHELVAVATLAALNMPNKCHDGGAKAHACADEMHEIHRPNGGEGRANEHAEKAQETKGGEN